ncbi:hypothetical protein LEUM_1038 [Leuconostoc mesenteroides subsp. mesenteroides ATCC 8293]|uniref:Uncharacterized protein n=1 Tax=Leuconostoc mesenteroides subsp. mesenteroides (strain ATCC 8293 / DSM 20343 / BCRC 11652 / CCM 1803 / JCM 6124 / NCDO 523 / NBRC 100496 / NCIMB 8023 / NCTC 12954 / NRRL B-1118 / 37Y) TaxID=203120 RepID=Q03XD4_LEUMM|nr:hypothetical protein LEUM_1038 [Leuconostoc mesenteroides subsp. mesenteroides ATCC 8293]STY37206.1 Uncharacterised protein [Leuconostoc mesenteroides]
MGNFILFLIFGFGIAFLYVRHNRDFEITSMSTIFVKIYFFNITGYSN